MRVSWILAGTAALALAACSESGTYDESAADIETNQSTAMEESSGAAAEVAKDAVEASADGSAVPALGDIPVTLPKLAYTYDFLWRMPAALPSHAISANDQSLCLLSPGTYRPSSVCHHITSQSSSSSSSSSSSAASCS